MKKTLLTMAVALLGSASAMALNPSMIENQTIYSFSANGNWAAAEDFFMSTGAIINVVTGQMTIIEPDEAGLIRVGRGNCISNHGTLVYNRDMACNKGYYMKDGKQYELPMKAGFKIAIPQAITSDDRYIVGLGGTDMYNNDISSVKQVFPLLWTLQGDGSYSEPVTLEYPDKDFQGLIPQTIIPNCISNDGRVIACQMVSNNGFLNKEIVWRLGEDGNWSYEILVDKLYTPEGIDLPGEPPVSHQPDPLDYMSEENRKDYLAEVAKFEADNTYPYPNYEDYMTKEELDAYEADNDYYFFGTDPSQFELDNQAFLDWMEASNKYYSSVPGFDLNSTSLAGNGKYLSAADSHDGVSSDLPCTAYFFNLETGEYVVKTHPESMTYPTGVADNGTMVARGEDDYVSFIAEIDEKEFKVLTEYMSAKYPAIYDWMKEYMSHDITITYWDEEKMQDVEITLEDVMIVGQPRINADCTVIGTWTGNIWSEEDPGYLYSYIFPLNGFSGIDNITADNAAVNALSLSIDRNGVITINGNAKALNVYDINGRLMLNVENPGATVKTNLTPGSYVIKAENADTEAVAKAVL